MANCDCSWTNDDACSNDDGSVCHTECCNGNGNGNGNGNAAAAGGQADDASCDEALGVGLGVGIGGFALFVLLLLFARSKSKGKGGDATAMSQVLLCSLGGASCVVLLAVVVGDHHDCSRRGSYGLAASLVSLVAVALLLLMAHFKPDAFALGAAVSGSVTAQAVLAGFFSAWWAAVAGVLTFWGPFEITSNGWFGSWAALLCSLLLLGDAFRPAASAAAAAREAAADARRAMAGLVVSAVVLLLACAGEVRDGSDVAAWGLAASALTCVLAGAMLLAPQKLSARQRTLALLWLTATWCTLVWFGTLDGPFAATGNGYFACWGGLLCCALELVATEGVEGVEVATAAGSDAAAPAPPPPTTPTTPTTQLRFLAVASFVVFLHSAGLREGYGAYALATAAVSLGAALVLLAHRALKPREARGLLGEEACACALLRGSSGGGGSGGSGEFWSVEAAAALGLSAWWAAGAGVATFLGPYQVTGNGYFGCWASLGHSLMLLSATHQRLRGGAVDAAAAAASSQDGSVPAPRAVLGLLASSIVLALACASHLGGDGGGGDGNGGDGDSEAAWGLTCGALSGVAASLLLLAPDGVPRRAVAPLCALLALLWCAVVGACTFSAPFTLTGNGFFASWGGLLCALALARDAQSAAWIVASRGGCCASPGRRTGSTAKKSHAAAATLAASATTAAVSVGGDDAQKPPPPPAAAPATATPAAAPPGGQAKAPGKDGAPPAPAELSAYTANWEPAAENRA